MPFQAVLFDLDGLLIDSEVLIEQAWRQASEEIGIELTHEQFLPMVGVATRIIQEMYRSVWGLDDDRFLKLYARRTEVLIDLYRRQLTPANLKPGASELLESLSAHGIPRALATLSRRPVVDVMLERTGIQEYFKAMVTAEEISRPKPEPDIFLEAARRLDVGPLDCIVLEDSPTGITAAYRAGMLPILVPDLLPSPPEVADLAHARFTTLHEAAVEVKCLLGLGNGSGKIENLNRKSETGKTNKNG